MVRKIELSILTLAIIIMFVIDAVMITRLIQSGAIIYLWARAPVNPSIELPTAIAVGQPFEYCVLKQDAGLASESLAGTPVPMDPVYLGPTPTEIAVSASILPTETLALETQQPVELIPTFEPTATQPVYDELAGWQVEVIDIGEFKESNFHIVVIGVGYANNAQDKSKLREVTFGLELAFTGVRIDFAYVRSPLNLNLEHADQAVDFSNAGDLDKMLAKIRRVHPVDGIAIAIETSSFLGTTNPLQFAMFTASDPNTLIIATHEIAHLVGLGDGYQAFYPERDLPNSELFYLDSMPRILSDALPKLESVPPMYEVGTCNGRKLYQFYESSNNIMGDFNPKGPNSWGDSVFTPLQIEVMNNFIATHK